MGKVKSDAVLTIGEFPKYLKITRSMLCKLAQKVGRHWRFRKESIDAWLDADAQVKKA
jgi:excisionase family DNA binding protein